MSQTEDSGDQPRSGGRVKRWGKRLACLLAFALLAGGIAYGYWDVVERRFEVIEEGVLYKSGALSPERMLSKVRDHEIRTVVDLRIPAEDGAIEPERDALEGAGVRYVHLPVQQIPDDESLDEFLRLMADPSNYPVLVHCKHGHGRSVLFAALYRIELLGWENDRARCDTRFLSFQGTFSPEGAKGKYLLDYVPDDAVLAAEDRG